jgi:hypothetical protein
MTSKKVLQTRGRKKFLAAAIPLILAAQAQGIEFHVGDVEMSLDTQLTIGSSWRTEERSTSLQQGFDGIGGTNAQNNNDGTLNFDKGDAFSQVFKGTHDFQVSYKNFGAFVRGKYWYDTLLEDGNKATFADATVDPLSKADGGAFSDDDASDYAKFSGAQILDAFVYGEFEVGGMPLDVRLGKQVLSWGESTFIQGGINQTNPFDVVALRRPGAELKEALIPVNMAFASIGLTENLSAEAFYQIGHQETVIAHCGTYFSTNDYAPEGCGPVETLAGNVTRDPQFKDGINRPSDDGQFGLAFRYFADSLDTEFGLFAMNVHSRVPLVSGAKADLDELALINDGATAVVSPTGATFNQAIAQYMSANSADQTTAKISVLSGLTTAAGALSGLSPAYFTENPSYFIEYPEDQQIAGLTFATNVAGVAVSGELTHKLDVPFQINATQLLGAVLTADAAKAVVLDGAGVSALGITTMDQFDAGVADGSLKGIMDVAVGAGAYETLIATIDGTVLTVTGSEFGLEAANLTDGEALGGFKTFDVTQLQVTGIKLFDQVLGANRFALIAEAGYTFVHDFDEDSSTKFDGNGALQDTVTEGSWGYRVRVSGDYSDVFAGVSLAPVVSFSHDVKGVAPAPGGNFIEDQQVLGLALNAEYANMYTASIGYTMYSGGLSNNKEDRDNASITLGVQF